MRNEDDCEVYMYLMYKHVETELHQALSLKVSAFGKRSSDRMKNRLDGTPFDKGTCCEMFLPAISCIVIELVDVLRDVVPPINTHKEAAEVPRTCA